MGRSGVESVGRSGVESVGHPHLCISEANPAVLLRCQISANATGKLSKATGISPDQAKAILNGLMEDQKLSPDALESLMQGGFDQALQVWECGSDGVRLH